MLKHCSYLLCCGLVTLTFAAAARADRTEGETTASTGTVRCGFSTFLRQGGSEAHQSFLSLRNLDPTEPIFVDRLRYFNAQGAVLFDSAVAGMLPPSSGGATLGGPGNNTLNPNQTTQFEAAPIVGFLPTQADRPGTVEVQWSAGRRGALTLQVSQTRVVRERNPLTGAILAERSRSSFSCRTIALR